MKKLAYIRLGLFTIRVMTAVALLTGFAGSVSSQTPPPLPKISELIYPPEAGGRVGTGAAPGETITIKGTGLIDERPSPLPTFVVFPIYDPSKPGGVGILEATPSSLNPTELQAVVPQNGLAGSIKVEWGQGDSATKSDPQPLNIRFNQMNPFQGNYDYVGITIQPNGNAFAPDGSAWSVVEQWGWQGFAGSSWLADSSKRISPNGRRTARMANCAQIDASCGEYAKLLRVAGGSSLLADGLTRTLPNGTRAAHIVTCEHNDDTGGDYGKLVQVIGNRPYWNCTHDDFTQPTQFCLGPDPRVGDRFYSSTQYRLSAAGAIEIYGQAASDMVAFTASGERLLREPCTGNYILYKRKTEPDGTVTETPTIVHHDGGLAAGRSVRGLTFLNPITGPGGHIGFFIFPTPGSNNALIERFNPDGTWRDEIPVYGTSYSPDFMASAFDCQGNIYYVESVPQVRPFVNGLLHKIAWLGGGDAVVDSDLHGTLSPNTFDEHFYFLSGINPAGDIYIEREDVNGDRIASSYAYWQRHPTVRGEGCKAANDELIQFDFSPEALAAMNKSRLAQGVDSGICNNGPFVPIPEKNISLGNLGSYGVEIKNEAGDKRPAPLTRIKVATERGSCTNTGIFVQGKVNLPMFDGQCLIIPGSTSCGAGCREILSIEKKDTCPTNWKPGDQPGNGAFQLVTIHSGAINFKYQYDWPIDVPGWLIPDSKKCGKDLDGNTAASTVCVGEMRIIIDEPTSGKLLAHGGGVNSGYDGIIAKWADLIGFPAPIIKAIVIQESNGKPRAYRYEPISNYFGDVLTGKSSIYKTAPGLSDFLIDNTNTQPPLPPSNDTNLCPDGERPTTKDVSDQDINGLYEENKKFRIKYSYAVIDHELDEAIRCNRITPAKCSVTVGQVLLANAAYYETERSCRDCQTDAFHNACNTSCDPTHACFWCTGNAVRFCPGGFRENWFNFPNSVPTYTHCNLTRVCVPFRGCATFDKADPLACIIDRMDHAPENFFGYPAQTMAASSYGLFQVMFPHIAATDNTAFSGDNWLGWRKNETDPKKRGPWEATNPDPPPGAENWYKVNIFEIVSMFLRLHVGKKNIESMQNDIPSLTKLFQLFADSLDPYNGHKFPSPECLNIMQYGDVVVQRAVGCSLLTKKAPVCTTGYCPKP